jgi:hypothetical protein
MRERLGWENTNPNLTATFHFANNGSARCFDLSRSHPTGLQRLQTKLTETYFSTAQGFTPHTAAHLLAPLYTFWH